MTGAPSVENRAAWIELARTTANLNQIAKHANERGELAIGGELVELRRAIERLRAELIGAIYDDEDGDDRETLEG
ncbi:MAG: plasmid mobilization relaxosome protein MobC [Alphaproteobacteria bacterium]|nr:plasmid mobilization relaxosome protein MobC [Alphaproteobacteria bacterium]